MTITVSEPAAAPAATPRISRALKDLIAAAIAFGAVLFAVVHFDLVALALAAGDGLEQQQLDLLVAAVPALALVAVLFAFRRWREAARLKRDLNQAIGDLARADALHQRMARQLRESEKLESMGKLAGGLAHALNDVLRPIVTLARSGAEDQDIPAETKTKLANILAAASRGNDIVRAVLTFATGRKHEPDCFDLGQAMDDIVARVGGDLAKTVTVETRIADDVGLVSINRGELTQVITNLVNNAADAMGHRGRVLIDLEACELDESGADFKGLIAGSYVRVTVTDQGPGIAADAMGHVFDPFFTTKDAGKAAGLGLALAYGLVRTWGGGIAAKSAVGSGAVFEVLVPRLTNVTALAA